MTLDEYLYELKNPDLVLAQQPSKTDFSDPLYCRKYAHNMPPLIAYKVKPPKCDLVNIEGDDNKRAVFFGWNNITEYELQGIQNIKQWLRENKNIEVPPGFDDRNLLKFIQANFFNMKNAGEKLANHFNWLATLPPEPCLTNYTLKLLQTGCFYIFGRDRFFRPCLVMDAEVMARLTKEDPECVESANFTALFIFLYQYLKNVMFLPGFADQWITIINLGKLGATSIPRKQVLAFADVCQANLMYFLHKSFYLNLSWGLNVVYKGLSGFINEETRAKMILTDKPTDPDMLNYFHPSQLERRFGGAAETPQNFWPPYIGKEFIPDKFKGEFPVVMSDEEYKSTLLENPELFVHPEFLNSPDQPSRDFIFTPPQQETPSSSESSSLGRSAQPRQSSYYSVR